MIKRGTGAKARNDGGGKTPMKSGFPPEPADAKIKKTEPADSFLKGGLPAGFLRDMPGILFRCLPESGWAVSFLSRGLGDLTGYPEGECIGKDLKAYNGIIHPLDRKKAWDSIAKAVEKREPYTIEYRIIRRDGKTRRVCEKGHCHAIRGQKVLDGIILDVTRKAAKAFRDDLSNYREIVEEAGHSMFLVDENGTFRFMNEHAAKVLGGSPADCIGKNMWDLFPKGYADRQMDSIRETLRTGKRLIIQAPLDNGKETRWYETSLNPLRTAPDEQTGVVIGIATDITETKKADEKLIGIINGVGIPTFVINKEHKIIHWNKALEGLTDIKREKVIGTDLQWSVFYSKKRPTLADLIIDGSENDVRRLYGSRFKKSDLVEGACEAIDFMPSRGESGQWIHYTVAPLRNSLGKIIGAIETAQDITEGKKTEEELLASEERYRNIFENSVEGIFQSTPDGRYTRVNPAFAHIFGYDSPGELLSDINDIGQQLYADPEDRKRATCVVGKEGNIRDFEVKCRKRDGEIIWASLNAKAVRDRSSGKVLFFEGSIEDITEHKKTHEELNRIRLELEDRVAERTKELALANESLRAENAERKKAEDLVRTLTKAVETTPTAILLIDLNGIIEYMNPSVQKIEHTLTDGSILGSMVFDYTDDAGRVQIKENVIPALFSEKQWRGEINIKTKDGCIYPTEMISSLVPDDSGKPKHFLANIYDISQRKKMESELQKAHDELEHRVLERTAQLEKAKDSMQASLMEKEVLLKEIHHRVKNNLQIISSLLSLQSRNLPDSGSYRMFQESQDRIRSIALVHEKLYQSEDLARIDFSAYLEKLTSHLMRSYTASPGRIKMEINTAGISLDINKAVPCSLIINELVSNALKYAFDPRTGGVIEITMRQDAEKAYLLEVRDNGSGFPGDLDFKNVSSLGLQLVNTLVDQLKGRIELERTGGTKFTITFPDTI